MIFFILAAAPALASVPWQVCVSPHGFYVDGYWGGDAPSGSPVSNAHESCGGRPVMFDRRFGLGRLGLATRASRSLD